MSLLRDPLAVFPLSAPRRVVSLVPSWTGTLIDLGLARVLAAVTDYCPQPPGAALPRLGGPKNINLPALLAFKPDLVLANQEENQRQQIEAIAGAGVPVWLTFPATIQDAVTDLYTVARLFRSEHALRAAQELERSGGWAIHSAAQQPPVRVFCPIWQGTFEPDTRWWMTFNDGTYSSAVLAACGGTNVFGDLARRYPLQAGLGLAEAEDPGGRDTRYPLVGVEAVRAARPEVILLPDEPYPYTSEQVADLQATFADTPAAQNGRILPVAGALLHWPGTMLARALAELPALLRRRE